jgi:hypothetical protein
MRVGPAVRSIALLLLALTSSCYVEAFTGSEHGTFEAANVPVGVSPDGLGYALRARDFTSDQQYGPLIQSRSVSVGAAVIGYSGGSATVEIRDVTGSIVLQQTVTSNLAQGSTLVHGVPPFKVWLSFRRFSGTFSLGIGPGE